MPPTIKDLSDSYASGCPMGEATTKSSRSSVSHPVSSITGLVHLLDARSTQIDFAQRQRLREFCCLKVRHYSTQASKGKL